MTQAITLEALHQEIIGLKSTLAKVFTATKETLDFEETVSYINTSKSYLYKLTSQGLIPHYKPNGKKIYFNRSELDQWLQQNRVKSQAEIISEADHHVNGI